MDNAEQKQIDTTENQGENQKTEDHAPSFDPSVVVKHDVKDPEWEKKKAHYKSSIENAFEALVPGMQISVNRTRPGWCAGWLDTIPVDFDENGYPNIDLQTIKDTFGGENLQLRFLDHNGQFLYGKTVHFRGIPPKENGFELENPAVKQRRELMELERANREQKTTQNNDALVKMMFDRQEKSYTQMLAVLSEKQKATNDPFAGMTAMMAMMEKFDKFRGGNGPQAPGDDIGSMISGLMGMLPNLQQNAAPQARQLPQVPAPLMPQAAMPAPHPPVQPGTAPHPPTQPAPVPQPAPPPAATQRPVAVPADATDDLEEMDLVDEIVGMEDLDIAETVAELMDRLGDERGQRVFQHFANMSAQAEAQPDPPPQTTIDPVPE